jgi:hypothetical protein
VVVTILYIEVVTVRTVGRTYDDEAGVDMAPGTADELATVEPAMEGVELAATGEEAGEGVGCGTKTRSTRTLSRPTYAWPRHWMLKTPAWLFELLGELYV